MKSFSDAHLKGKVTLTVGFGTQSKFGRA